MPSYVIKAARDRDLYAIWSTVVDHVTFVSTRAEVLAILVQEDCCQNPHHHPDPLHTPESRMQRADETGTSALWRVEGHPVVYSWDDESLIVQILGVGYRTLPRAYLAAYLTFVASSNHDDACALTVPLDDAREED